MSVAAITEALRGDELEERELAEVGARSEPGHLDAVALDDGLAFDDQRELTSELALADHRTAGRHVHLVGERVDATQLVVGAVGEDRQCLEHRRQIGLPGQLSLRCRAIGANLTDYRSAERGDVRPTDVERRREG